MSYKPAMKKYVWRIAFEEIQCFDLIWIYIIHTKEVVTKNKQSIFIQDKGDGL